MSKMRGFSLLEMLIVVTIIGILAAIALPAYGDYVLRANRTVGKSVLLQISGKQESFFVDRKRYATNLQDLGYPGTAGNPVFLTRDGNAKAATSSDAVYSVTLAAYSAAGVANCSATGAATTTQFAIIATPINTQAKDTKCKKICVGSVGDKGAEGPDGAGCWKS